MIGNSNDISPQRPRGVFWETELVLRVDVPDALIGDCFYLQHLVTAIEAWGQTTRR